jgi:hypothetical protein
MVETQQI